MVSGESPVPGWYADPLDAGKIRWWDGATWAEHTRDFPSSLGAAAASAPVGAGVPPAWPSGEPNATAASAFPVPPEPVVEPMAPSVAEWGSPPPSWGTGLGGPEGLAGGTPDLAPEFGADRLDVSSSVLPGAAAGAPPGPMMPPGVGEPAAPAPPVPPEAGAQPPAVGGYSTPGFGQPEAAAGIPGVPSYSTEFGAGASSYSAAPGPGGVGYAMPDATRIEPSSAGPAGPGGPPAPKRGRSSKALVILLVVLGVLIVVAAAVWFFLLRNSNSASDIKPTGSPRVTQSSGATAAAEACTATVQKMTADTLTATAINVLRATATNQDLQVDRDWFTEVTGRAAAIMQSTGNTCLDAVRAGQAPAKYGTFITVFNKSIADGASIAAQAAASPTGVTPEGKATLEADAAALQAAMVAVAPSAPSAPATAPPPVG